MSTIAWQWMVWLYALGVDEKGTSPSVQPTSQTPAHLPADTTNLQVSNMGLTPISHLWTASYVCLAIQQGTELQVGGRHTWV